MDPSSILRRRNYQIKEDQLWLQVLERLLDLFLNRQGIHSDEIMNFNRFMEQIPLLVQEQGNIHHLDEQNRLHRIRLQDCYFVRPYENQFGIDNPEQALLRGHYEVQIRGSVIYTIHSCPDLKMKEANDNNDDDDTISDAPPPTQTEMEEDEEEEEVLGPVEEEEEEEEEVVLDIFQEMDLDEMKEEEEEPVAPSKPKGFYFQSEIYANFTVQEHHVIKTNRLLMEFTPLLGSILCHWGAHGTLFMSPFLLAKPYLTVPSFIIGRIFKHCPWEYYSINNRVIGLGAKVEYRGRFVAAQKRFRTNSTLKFFLTPKKTKAEVFYYRFTVQIPYEKPDTYIPIGVLVLAYGWTLPDFWQAVSFFLGPDRSLPCMELFYYMLLYDLDGCQTQEDAWRRLSKCFARSRKLSQEDGISYIIFTLHSEFLPNLNQEDEENAQRQRPRENLLKGYTIAQCVAELIQGNEEVKKLKPDKDHWPLRDRRLQAFKRVQLPGIKLCVLLREYMKDYTKKAGAKLKECLEKKKPIDLNTVLNKKNIKITASVKNGVFASGHDVAESNQNKTQMMITGYCSDSMHSQTQKMIKSDIRKASQPEPLLTTGDQAGRECLFLTPESEHCSLTRFKSLGAFISGPLDLVQYNQRLIQLLAGSGLVVMIDPVTQRCPPGLDGWSVVIDLLGGIAGWTQDVMGLYRYCRTKRRQGCLYRFLGMAWDRHRREFHFSGDEGRLMRPLIVMEHLPQLISAVNSESFLMTPQPLNWLLYRGLIEYVDAWEEFSGWIVVADSLTRAVEAQFHQTHLEIHGCLTMNLTVSNAFANFNQGPRRLYTGNMRKRCMALKLYVDRGTTKSYRIYYGVKPLSSEPVDRAMGLRNREPNGFNVTVGFLSLGDDQEDAWIIKKEAVDRGLGMSTQFQVVVVSLGANCFFQRPDSKCRGKADPVKYEALQPDGKPKIGAVISNGAAIVGRVFQSRQEGKMVQRCVSQFIAWNESYVVYQVDTYPEGPGREVEIIRVTLQKSHVPEMGDKCFFGHGQKGTLTRLVPSVDLPFVAAGPNKGQVFDIFVNTCGMMRITQGFNLGLLSNKARALSPQALSQYETLFCSSTKVEERLKIIMAILTHYGFHPSGRDKVICGKTGRIIRCVVYNGMEVLHFLHHLAEDKLRSRFHMGPRNEFTRLTTSGKKFFGGIRFGEMEGWNLMAHGMPYMFRNIYYINANNFLIFWCLRCQAQAVGCLSSQYFFCRLCRRKDQVVRLPVPYVGHLGFQEAYSAGWGHRYGVKLLPENEQGVDDAKSFVN